MELAIVIPVAILAGVAGLGVMAVRRSQARQQALRQAVSDWAARNNFHCQHNLSDELPLRISGREDELEFVLECRTPRQANDHRSPEMVWTCRARAAESLELMVLDRKVYDFSQSKLGQMVTSMAAGAASGWPRAGAQQRWLERIQALKSFQPVPASLGAGRFVALARQPERWPELLSREVVALLEAWPESKRVFELPTVTLDQNGVEVEVAGMLLEEQKLHHLIRLGAAVVRAVQASDR